MFIHFESSFFKKTVVFAGANLRDDEAHRRLRVLDEIESALTEERLQSYVSYKSRWSCILSSTFSKESKYSVSNRAMREQDRYWRVQSSIKKLSKLVKGARTLKNEAEILEATISHVVFLRLV